MTSNEKDEWQQQLQHKGFRVIKEVHSYTMLVQIRTTDQPGDTVTIAELSSEWDHPRYYTLYKTELEHIFRLMNNSRQIF